jgi:PKD repeat protein
VPLPRSLRRAVALVMCLAMALPPLIAPAALARVHRTPFPKSHGSAAARMVALARRELGKGVHEIPDGSNRAPAIRRYETATRGAMFGAPWCAYFVSYIAKTAGAPIGPGGSGLGYVPYIRAWAKQTHRWTQRPRPGDLITFPEHVGLVENVYANHTLTTIEGNAGNAVRRRWRRWGEAMGYVRVAKGSKSAPAPAPAPAPKKAPKPKPAPAGEPLRARITVYPDDTIAPGQTVSFTSNDSSGDIVSSSWDFDGKGKFQAKGDSVDHRYDKAGTYKVTLKVTDSRKRTATATQTITVRTNQAPVAVMSLNSQNLTVGDTLKGDASRSSDPDGRIVKYEWDLNGDGQWAEDGKTHSFEFGDPGDYNVGLRVTDDSGNVTETHLPVHVADLPDPVANMACDTTTVLAGHSVHCWADDSASPVKIVRHGWDLDGDGADDKTGRDIRVTFDKAGPETIRMRAYDQNGRSADATVAITVTDNPPTAALSGPSTVGLGKTATFDGTGSDDVDGDIVSWQWDLDGDGTYESSGARPSFVYRAPGTYTVKLRVTDDDGGQATATSTIRVTDQAPTPVITLPPSSTRHVNTDLQFDATSSTDPDSDIATYEWDFNNDGVYETTGARPTWRYTTTGRKTIRLRVTDVWGVSATVTSTSLVVS